MRNATAAALPAGDSDYVEQILRERLVELTIVDLGTGSFLGRFSIDPRTARGRKRLVAIAVVAVVALSFVAVIPPAAITVVGVLPSLLDVLEPDAIPQTDVPLRTIDRADVPVARRRRSSFRTSHRWSPGRDQTTRSAPNKSDSMS